MFGNPETTPGGMALKYAASVRIDIRKKEDIKDKSGNSVGIVSKVKVIKNKMAPPMKVTEFSIMYGKGIDEHGCVLDVAIETGVLTQKGAWIYFEGELFAQGRDNAINQLKENQEVFEKVKAKIQTQS
jgi:recombination protein RecA